MAEPYLKYRTRFTSSLKNELVPLFDALSRSTRVPKSRLLDEAIEDLLKKYDAPLPTRQGCAVKYDLRSCERCFACEMRANARVKWRF